MKHEMRVIEEEDGCCSVNYVYGSASFEVVGFDEPLELMVLSLVEIHGAEKVEKALGAVNYGQQR